MQTGSLLGNSDGRDILKQYNFLELNFLLITLRYTI